MKKQDDAILFHFSANAVMAKEICNRIPIKLGEAEVRRFADGEIFACPVNSVRNKHVFILNSTCPPVTDRLMETLIFIDALKRASAREITVIAPYFGYSRQDRKSRPREPITARLVADIIQAAGADRVVMLDLHTPQLQGFFSIPVDNATAIPLFANYLEKNLNLEDATIVSPDHGGVARVQALASILEKPIAIIDKRRHKSNVAEVVNIVGDISGRTCILVDDIVDTAGTLTESANALLHAGAKKVYAVITHGLFSGDAIEKIEKSGVEKLIITDSIPLVRESKKIDVVSISDLIAKIIEAIRSGNALSEIYK